MRYFQLFFKYLIKKGAIFFKAPKIFPGVLTFTAKTVTIGVLSFIKQGEEHGIPR